ncbi:MAG TPA: response regulator [Gemmatimonadaceae bacterium]|nr:response regulator [Gemmatimonadaceae bacterium]
MPTPLRLLLVEDSENDALLLVRTLRQAGFAVTHERVDSAPALRAALSHGPWDVVISDFNMPTFNGRQALTMVRDADRDVPFLFVSGSVGEDIAVEAMRSGAQDYVMKGNLTRLAPAIQRELNDLRERKRLEAQFLQAQKMESVGQLAGGIAHDFNNLLTVIMSYSEFLLEDFAENDERREDLLQIRSAAEAATNLSRQLLVFSRAEALRPQVMPINDVLTDATKLIRRIIGENVELVLALQPDAGMVEVDQGLLAQAVLNLAINARDAMPNGGKLVVETRNTDHDGASVTLAVSDNGIGMDAAVQSRLFQPFFTTKAPGKGTGLGLMQVYTAVQQCRGTLNVYSEPNIGTTFKIHLPRVITGADAAHAVVRPPAPARPGETVLIVEDAAAVRTVARQVLERLGYLVHEAPDGGTALHLVERLQGEIHLLMTDVVMPGMNGRDLAKRMREVRPSVRVLFTSGYTDDAARHLGVLEPGGEYLHKPFTPEQLGRKVRDAIDETRVS